MSVQHHNAFFSEPPVYDAWLRATAREQAIWYQERVRELQQQNEYGRMLYDRHPLLNPEALIADQKLVAHYHKQIAFRMNMLLYGSYGIAS